MPMKKNIYILRIYNIRRITYMARHVTSRALVVVYHGTRHLILMAFKQKMNARNEV